MAKQRQYGSGGTVIRENDIGETAFVIEQQSRNRTRTSAIRIKRVSLHILFGQANRNHQQAPKNKNRYKPGIEQAAR